MAVSFKIERKNTRAVPVGDIIIGDNNPISVQSMCATKTQDIEATVNQISLLKDYGADIIRIAVDSKRDVEAVAKIRKRVKANLVVDLQESYRFADLIAPHVDKIRYNPGHLYHFDKEISVADKVKSIVKAAIENDCALRVGVNFGSIDPDQKELHSDRFEAAIHSVHQHVEILEDLGFSRYCVSLKSSDPNDVIEIYKRFAERYPFIPLHLGVTEAGLLPMGEIKSRIAFENLLAIGIGDTLRVSLTLPNERKYEEIVVGKKIIEDVYNGKFLSVPRFEQNGLNIISCPSCSRVENSSFVQLAEKVKEVSEFAKDHNITVAVMGCRVNGPGETDDADLGLWCAPKHVNFKKKSEIIGSFSYDEILPKFKDELEKLIRMRAIA